LAIGVVGVALVVVVVKIDRKSGDFGAQAPADTVSAAIVAAAALKRAGLTVA
jgi:hypothetical protein